MIDAARTTISKRENARSTPDYSITQEFCGALTRNADRATNSRGAAKEPQHDASRHAGKPL